MITKTLAETYALLCELHPNNRSWEYNYPESSDEQVELAVAAAVHEAARLTPDSLRAHALLMDIYHQMPQKLPQLLMALALSLSSKDESMLRETYGILELTQPSLHPVPCSSPSGRSSAM
jgi:hypothetical protein